MQNSNDYSKRLSNVINSLVEDVLNTSDEEIIKSEFEGMDNDTKTIGNIIKKNIEEYKQEELKSISADYKNALLNYQVKSTNFTQKFQDKLNFLLSKIKGNKELENRLTLAFREKQDINEGDLDSLISDLHNLNLLDEDDL